jgi:hypothetical protein
MKMRTIQAVGCWLITDHRSRMKLRFRTTEQIKMICSMVNISGDDPPKEERDSAAVAPNAKEPMSTARRPPDQRAARISIMQMRAPAGKSCIPANLDIFRPDVGRWEKL